MVSPQRTTALVGGGREEKSVEPVYNINTNPIVTIKNGAPAQTPIFRVVLVLYFSSFLLLLSDRKSVV